MHRNDAWSALLELSRLARYFDMMTRRYRRYRILSRILLACSALGPPVAIILDAVSLTATEQAIATAFATVFIMFVLAADLVLDFGKHAAVLDTIRKDLAVLEREGRDVWESGKEFERLVVIQRRMLEVSSRTELSTDDRLNRLSATHSYSAEAARYAT